VDHGAFAGGESGAVIDNYTDIWCGRCWSCLWADVDAHTRYPAWSDMTERPEASFG